jgi:trehalose synthase
MSATTVRNEWTERAWAFIRPYVEMAHAHVFSRESFAPEWIDRAWLGATPPSIDPFTPKNQELTPNEVLSLLAAAGLLAEDGREPDARVRHRADVVREGGPPDRLTPLVVQVSRWDRMKDMPGVLEGFARYVHAQPAHLVLAGPAVTGVSDDSEGEEVWRETIAAWRALPRSDRSRAHLASVPMDDPLENAIVINALQRHSAVVVQKSLAEGFGLTVAEAMWKTRPVVATAVGGIVDQVIDDETGLLVDNPHDLEAFGALGWVSMAASSFTWLWPAASRTISFGRRSRKGSRSRTCALPFRGDFSGDPAVSEEITYEVEIDGDAAPERLRGLVQLVDGIAEIPNSLRHGTPVRIGEVRVQP